MSIPAVEPITALAWALEIGDVKRFRSIKQAISYCGLCGAEDNSAGVAKRRSATVQRSANRRSVAPQFASIDSLLLNGMGPSGFRTDGAILFTLNALAVVPEHNRGLDSNRAPG
jgi:Transposase IS116/IS110/IS902 family